MEPVLPLSTSALAVSPDGRSVVMVGAAGGVRRLFLRRLDRAESSEVPGSNSANAAAFSPDGRNLAFIVSNGTIVRLSLNDFERKVLTADVDLGGGVVWSPAGIVFGRHGTLWIVSPDGSQPRALTVLNAARKEVLHDHPLAPPGERVVLFASLTAEPGAERLEAVAPEGGKRSVIARRRRRCGRPGICIREDGGWPPIRPAAAALLGRPSLWAPASWRAWGPATSDSGSLTGTCHLRQGSTPTSWFRSLGWSRLTLDCQLALRGPAVSPMDTESCSTATTAVEELDLARDDGTAHRRRARQLSHGILTGRGLRSGVSIHRFGRRRRQRCRDPYVVASTTSVLAGTDRTPSSRSWRPETSADVFLMSLTGAFEPKPLVATPAYEGGPNLARRARRSAVGRLGTAGIYVGRFRLSPMAGVEGGACRPVGSSAADLLPQRPASSP